MHHDMIRSQTQIMSETIEWSRTIYNLTFERCIRLSIHTLNLCSMITRHNKIKIYVWMAWNLNTITLKPHSNICSTKSPKSHRTPITNKTLVWTLAKPKNKRQKYSIEGWNHVLLKRELLRKWNLHHVYVSFLINLLVK